MSSAPSATVTTTAATTTATKPPVTTQPPTSTTAANQENNWPANPLSDFEYYTNDTAAGIEKHIGNAATVVIPEEIVGTDPFAAGTVLYYDPNAAGWDTTPLKDQYELVAR